MSSRRVLGFALGLPVAVLIVAQLVPFGRDHANPPITAPVAWDSPRTEQLARRACYDCHSNETKWPWYSNLAPMSWRIQTHVNEGREKLNFSAFQPADEKVAESAGEAAETVQKGEMPMSDYLLAHADARLSAGEKQALIAGLRKTFAAFGAGGEGGERAGGAAGGEAAERGGRGESGERGGEDEAHERWEHSTKAPSR